MSGSESKTWLVAYDIREPRRLRRLHRLLKQEGNAVQYSAFCVEACDRDIASLLDAVRQLIDERVDDVRAYHVPEHCKVWQFGRGHLPDGIHLTGSVAVRRLLNVADLQPNSAARDEPVPS